MKWIILLVFLFSFSFTLKAQDLSQFDFPYLLGDWYWFSSNENKNNAPYKAINIRFTSDYRFNIKLLNKNGTVQQSNGSYDLDDFTLVFDDEKSETQYHEYRLNHNQLMLKNITFTKLLTQDLSGAWYSEKIEGNDVNEQVTDLALMLRPDFLFLVKVVGEQGESVTHRGVYFLEDNNLVLIYKDGRHYSQFELEEDTLTLTNNQFDMQAVFNRFVE